MVIKSILISALIGIQSVGMVQDIESTKTKDAQVKQQATGQNEIEIFYMYSKGNDNFFLDPLAEFENVIAVSDTDLIEWNIDKSNLHHGNKFIGLFDQSGWDLLGIK